MESFYAGGIASRIEKEASRVETEPAAGEFTIVVQAPLFAKESLNRLAGLAYFINFNCPAECVRQSAF